MNKKIEELIVKISTDPFNPELNFECAVEYQKLNQTASAVSFYLRTAEYGYITYPLLAYNSLLRMAKCFEDQNDRINSVSNCILQAVALMPERQEAYFMMSNFYEKNSNWQESYTWAEMGLTKKELEGLPADIGFLGEYCLIFEKAVSAWWIGKREESKKLFSSLLEKYNMREDYANGCKYNLEKL